MRSGIGIRRQAKGETTDVSVNISTDVRDDTAETAHPIDPQNSCAVAIDTESRPLFRSTSPKVEYAASSPYYDVLLYSFTPELKSKQKKSTRTSSTHSKQTVKSTRDNEDVVKNTTTCNSSVLEPKRTSLHIDDSEKLGDGDQSPIYDPYVQKTYIELFRTGGDFDAHIRNKPSNHSTRRYFQTNSTPNHPTLSVFAEHCVSGRYAKVKQILESNSVRKGKSWKVMIEMLETRETVLRLSPLLLVFCMLHKIGIVKMNKSDPLSGGDTKRELNPISATDSWMNYIDQLEQNLVKVVAELLLYGASPIAKDVCGRTVYFYGASIYATPRSLHAVAMCGSAAMTAHFFGKEVLLRDFDTKSNFQSNVVALHNGMRGLVGGYQVCTGHRIVFVFGHQSEVAVPHQNIRLVNTSDKVPESALNLCNVQDRFGHVCLTELYGSKRQDVVKCLLDKHHASIDIVDWTGKSIRHRSFAISTNSTAKASELLDDEMATAQIIVAHALKLGRQELKRIDNICSACKIPNIDNDSKMLKACQRCMSVKYCSEKCQVEHWTTGGHRKECSRLRKLYNECITIDKSSILDSTRSGNHPSLEKPLQVAFDEVFTVKVELIDQQNEAAVPMLHIYDKSVKCDFIVTMRDGSGTTNCSTLLEKVKAESVTAGTAIYLAASFDVKGRCSIYVNRRKLRTW